MARVANKTKKAEVVNEEVKIEVPEKRTSSRK